MEYSVVFNVESRFRQEWKYPSYPARGISGRFMQDEIDMGLIVRVTLRNRETGEKEMLILWGFKSIDDLNRVFDCIYGYTQYPSTRVVSIPEFFSRFETNPRTSLPVASLLVDFRAPPFEIIHESRIDKAKEYYDQCKRKT